MVGGRHVGFFVEGYGGFTVLPRWDDRPGYHQLGSAEDTLVTYQPGAPERENHWLAGGRAGYQTPHASGSVSFHDQQVKGGVSQRNLGLDVGAQPFDLAFLGASALLELDSGRFANARFWIDATRTPASTSARSFCTPSRRCLSRQSVPPVFSTDTYEEVGGTLTAKILKLAAPWRPTVTSRPIRAPARARAARWPRVSPRAAGIRRSCASPTPG
jgi:hypothetical protein